ncbi:MAG: hypothetical protein NC094_01025 [Bacteroidales bacterium]|nr:hypothetical protein [Lachnoclostridium sp.]MCM1382972.1 hypothetical protein [Lachnoclostridium sp.]MCM1463975.1 hypothetical protein [Bacteroidales bacterium]
MKIKQSAVAMTAEREASRTYAMNVTAIGDRYWVNGVSSQASQEKEESAFLGWSKQAATLELSSDAKEKGQKASQKEEQPWQQKQDKNAAGKGKNLAERLSELTGRDSQPHKVDTEEDFKIKMLKQLLESLRAMQNHRRPNYEDRNKKNRQIFDFQMSARQSSSFAFAAVGSSQVVRPSGGTRAQIGVGHWEERVTMSKIFTEKEVTSFSTAGVVETADGRSINFNLNLEMSREFTQAVGITEYNRKTFCVDPLVINLEGNPASFSDQTFFFDLDSDGKKEEISNLKSGSGFLALDKNGDGIINDGSELFGTKSGDGFKDLAAYDEDGNGWIDEDDSVFKHLKVWTKDADGHDRLIDISKAGVGAIYLGHAATEFSAKTLDTNETQGIIRSTGIFLKESGEVGTIQHVDLVI